MARPNRLARPTKAFFDRPLSIVRVPKTQRWIRLHRTEYTPSHFGNSGDNRFDARDRSFGVLYLARRVNGSFVEVVCRQRERHVTADRLQQYRVAEFYASRNLRLVDLAGKGLVRMGIDARIATGSYATSQQWSQAFYDHPDRADGILYPSRHDPKQHLAAVFERAQPLLTAKSRGSLDDYLGDGLYALLDRYDIALL